MKANRDFLKAYSWDERDRVGTDMTRGVSQPLTQKPEKAGAELISLILPEDFTCGNMVIREVILQRRSRRRYTSGSLTLEELSYLLWATQGMREPGVSDQISKRTVPSGGARHPFETYLIINRVDGLETGLYRYLPGNHKLCFLESDPMLPGKVVEGTRGQSFVGDGAVIFIWTAIPYRGEWRYHNAAHKMIAIDAGHVCQNLYLACESIGCGTCAIAAYNQDKMDALVGVDGDNEFVVYAAPVGKI
jgi:SagB-type dehydrogenase family enzyme